MDKTAGRFVSLVVGLVLVLSWPGCDSRPSARHEGKVPADTQPATGPATSGPAPRIQVDRPRLDLGKRWSTEPTITHDFVIKNAGQLPLRIVSVVSDCSCTTVGQKNVSIDPGKSWNLTVSMEPARLNPLVAMKITVISNDPVQPSFDLTIVGLIDVPITIDPHNGTYFGTVGKDDTPTKTLTLKNNTDDTLDLKLIRCEGNTFEANLEPLEAGKKWRLILRAKPPYQEGVNSGLMRFSTGVKVMPVLEIRPQAYLRPRIVVTPNPVRVPMPLTEDTIQRIFIRSFGAGDLRVLRVSTPMLGLKTEVSGGPNSKLHTISLRLSKGLTLPPEGGELTIETDDREYRQIKVMIVGAPAIPTATSPPAEPASVK